MDENKRDFKGIWIPKVVWLNTKLTLQEKVFLVEIDSLDNKDGCFASNDYFAKFFGLSKTRVSLVITSLIKKGFINSILIREKGNKRILKRIINKTTRPSITYIKDPLKQKLKDNNTTNNISNNTDNKSSSHEIKLLYSSLLKQHNIIYIPTSAEYITLANGYKKYINAGVMHDNIKKAMNVWFDKKIGAWCGYKLGNFWGDFGKTQLNKEGVATNKPERKMVKEKMAWLPE
jgi:hypothetical protein